MQVSFVTLALQQKSPNEAASLLGCDVKTAKERLAQAHRTLRTRRENIQNAVNLLLADNIVRPDVNPRSWEEVALGLKRVV